MHFCNICNTFNKFEDNIYRKSSKCSNCGSLERHRALAIHLWHYLPAMLNAKILHFAPEGFLRHLLTSIPNTYLSSRYNPETKKGDIKNIEYKDNFFDFIILNQVLEHIDDDTRALQELYRVTKPGGHVFITVPLIHQYQKYYYRRIDGTFIDHILEIDPDKTYMPKIKATPEECLKLYGQRDHLRIYGTKDFMKQCEEVGFNVHFADVHSYPKHYRELLNLIDDVFILTKK